MIIAFALLPYFIYTALQKSLLDDNFNTWISKPGAMFISLAAAIPLFGVTYIYSRKTFLRKILSNTNSYFIDYSIFVSSMVYLIAFSVSIIYRPILIPKYLIIIYPLLLTSVAVFLVNVYEKSSKLIGSICMCFIFIWIVGGHEAEPFEGRSNYSSVYHESLAYVSKDAQAHPQNNSMELPHLYTNTAAQSFYNYSQLPDYDKDSDHDVVYFCPPNAEPKRMYMGVESLGIDRDRILQIRVNKKDSVFKIYTK